jgi:hypothetical protein
LALKLSHEGEREMSGHKPPRRNNPNPHNVPDPPGQVDATVQQIHDDVRADTRNEFNQMVADGQLTPPWRHGFRILEGPVPAGSDLAGITTTTQSSKNPTPRSATYRTIKDLDPKKAGLAMVDADGQKLLQDTLTNIINRLVAAGLTGQFNAVVRVCPFKPDHTQDHDGCGCGCNS